MPLTRKKRLRRKSTERRGVTAVEYAIVFPVILFTFFGLWEYARLEMIRQATATACYEGARRGTLPGATTTAMDTAAQDALAIYSLQGASITTGVTDELATCDITLPLDQNTWVAFFIAPNRNVVSSCEFSRELFGD